MQSRKSSLIEQICNVGSGFFISLLYWQVFIVPQLEMVDELTLAFNSSITLQFTIVSVVRGYFFRRLFNYFTIRGQDGYQRHNQY